MNIFNHYENSSGLSIAAAHYTRLMTCCRVLAFCDSSCMNYRGGTRRSHARNVTLGCAQANSGAGVRIRHTPSNLSPVVYLHIFTSSATGICTVDLLSRPLGVAVVSCRLSAPTAATDWPGSVGFTRSVSAWTVHTGHSYLILRQQTSVTYFEWGGRWWPKSRDIKTITCIAIENAASDVYLW